MADTTTEQALALSTGIVGALHAAGVLRPAGFVEVQTTPPPAGPGPQVGQNVGARIGQINRFTATGAAVVRLELEDAAAPSATYVLELHFDDKTYLPEFDRLQMTAKPTEVYVQMQIQKRLSDRIYGVTLDALSVRTDYRKHLAA